MKRVLIKIELLRCAQEDQLIVASWVSHQCLSNLNTLNTIVTHFKFATPDIILKNWQDINGFFLAFCTNTDKIFHLIKSGHDQDHNNSILKKLKNNYDFYQSLLKIVGPKNIKDYPLGYTYEKINSVMNSMIACFENDKDSESTNS